MPFKDLQEAIEEEFGQSSLDRFNRDGMSIHNLEQDKESRRNYERWYSKQVLYPRHKELYRLKARQYYWLHKLLQDEQWFKRVASWEKRSKLALTPGTKEYRVKMACQRRWVKKKYQTDPVFRAKWNARTRRYYERKKQDKEWVKRRLEAQKARRKKSHAKDIEYQRKYRLRPEVKAKMKAYNEAYRERTREKRLAYLKAWRARKKNGQKTTSSA